MPTNTIACGNCGAEINYDPGNQALKCPFCGAVTEIAKEEDITPARADLLIPLTIDKSALIKAVQSYMASGAYTPDDLIETGQITKSELLYVPGYLFNVDYSAKWTASFGFDRQEQYTVYERKQVGTEPWGQVDSSGHRPTRPVYGQVPVTKTKTVTDWRPVNGQDEGSHQLIAYAGKTLNSPSLAELAESCSNRNAATAFNPSFVTGLSIEEFISSESKAFSERAKDRLDKLIEAGVKQHAQGDHQKDWHWTSNISKESYTILLPVCHAVFEYSGVTYNFWTDGTDTSRKVADSLPIDKDRKSIVIRGFAPSAAAFAAMPMAGLLLGNGVMNGITGAGVGVLVAAIGYGWVRRMSIVAYSKKVREATLMQLQAENSSTADMSDEERGKLVKSYSKPKKNIFANTAKDKILIPALSVAALLGGFAPSIQYSKFTPASATIAAAEQTPVPNPSVAASSPEPVTSSPMETASSPEASATTPAITAASEAPVQVTAPVPQAPVQTDVEASKPPTLTGAISQLSPDSAVIRMLDAATRSADAEVKELRAQIESMSKPARGDRKVARGLNNDAMLLLKDGRFAEAIDVLKKASVADPADVEIIDNLSYSALKAGRPDDAARFAQAALSIAPGRSSAWANLGISLAQSAKETQAVAAFANAYRFSGNQTKTIEYFEKLAADDVNVNVKKAAAKAIEAAKTMK